MQKISELGSHYQRQYLVHAHALNAAITLLAETTNLSQEYWAESLAQVALEVIPSMSDEEVKATVQDAEAQRTNPNSVQKLRTKKNEN